MTQLSKYFSESEFLRSETAILHKIKNTWDKPIHRDNAIVLCKRLDGAREIFGALKTTSGYRNERVNRLVGGARSSKHLTGEAWDGFPLSGELEELYQWGLKHWKGGVAINRRLLFVHFDTGPKRTWNY